MSFPTTYHDTTLPSGASVHFAHAGLPLDSPASTPTVLLLHGFPTSSTQYRNLIPLIAATGKYRVIAPDLPGFGLTTTPANFTFTFDNLAETIDEWLHHLKIRKFAVYVFDYGAPTGFRLATTTDAEVVGVISQNGNAFVEGFGADFWAPLQKWWTSNDRSDSASNEALRGACSIDVTKWQYVTGTPADRLARIDPERWLLDYHLNLKGDEAQKKQLDLFFNYGTNPALYPTWQKWMKESGVPVLAVWGKGDECFIPSGAEQYGELLGNQAKVVLLDGGHFLLESHVEEVAKEINEFLESKVKW